MKQKAILFIVGMFIGAIVSTTSVILYINNTNSNSSTEISNQLELPSGEMNQDNQTENTTESSNNN